jgi:catalase
VIGAWGEGARVLEQAGVAASEGVVVAESATSALAEVQSLMSSHRVWGRFPASVS